MNNTSDISVLNILQNGGIIGYVTIFFSLVGFVLCLFSIFNSLNQTRSKLPLSLKLLMLFAVITVLTGAFGTLAGYVEVFAQLGTSTGSAKVSVMELGNQMARITVQYALISFLIQLPFIMLSFFILHNRSKNLNIPELSIVSQIRKIPILCYPVLLLFIPTVFGLASSLWTIEKVVMQKTGEPMPLFLKMNIDILFKIEMLCSVFAILLLLVLFVQMILKKVKTGDPNE